MALNSSDCLKGQSSGTSDGHINGSYLRISGFNSGICEKSEMTLNMNKTKMQM
jgi:hypothetical protein